MAKRDLRMIWSLVVLLSAGLTALVTYGGILSPIQPILVFWFMLVCPGMAFVRLFHLWDPISEWTLAIALSLAIDAIVALLMIYATGWNPGAGLLVVLVLSVIGALIPAREPVSLPKERSAGLVKR